ncbi:MAG: acyl-ACP--UDP-N-acetylglucosamine O-acyltransferase [Gemmatimonadetes bacterium]|nr:acyl-ACP--UDP-N-acetylglucosamine O-acyltransferase [Gemmatimonadota bacterium]
MSVAIHPTAIVDRGAELGRDVEIGPYVVVGPGVTLADQVRIAPHAVIERNAIIGRGCEIGVGAVIGGDPQDVKYRGEPTRVQIGEGTRIREYVTINRGTIATGRTIVGRRCYLMSYVHVGHDCVLEDDVVLANAVQLGGHVRLQQCASIGGSSAVHQFARIGTYAFVGGGSRISRDVPPYAKAAGNPLKLYGINAVGLRRAGFDPETRLALKRAFRLLFNSDLTTSEAVDRLRGEEHDHSEVIRLLDFFSRSDRGVLV